MTSSSILGSRLLILAVLAVTGWLALGTVSAQPASDGWAWLTVTGAPADGGSVERAVDGKLVQRYELIEIGKTATVIAHSNVGWRFVRWSGDLTGTQPTQFLYVDGDKAVTAHWERILESGGAGDVGGTNPLAPQGNDAMVESLSVGGDHACALTFDGDILCWGRNHVGQSDSPYSVQDGTTAGLDLGNDYSCIWVSNRAYGNDWKCWGSRTRPEVVVQRDHDDYWWPSSIGAEQRCGPYSGWSEWSGAWRIYRYCGPGSSGSSVGNPAPAIVGGSHRCTLRGSSLTCRGGNGFGQSNVPEGQYVSADAGKNHTCAVTVDETILCWGDNLQGQANPPHRDDVVKVSSNGFADFSCALTSESKVTCWGSNRYGQLQVPPAIAASAPAPEPVISVTPAEHDDFFIVRLIARRLADGRVEFGLRLEDGQYLLPETRHLSANPTRQQWLNSSPVEFYGVPLGRISVRRIIDGSTELSFVPQAGQRILPSGFTFGRNAPVNSWRRTEEFEIPIPGCRISVPIEDSVWIPEVDVKIDNSSATYRVRSVAGPEESRQYLVCTNGQSNSISSDTYEHALFTAAMQQVYLGSFVGALPESGSWWDPTGLTASSRFKDWLSNWDSYIGQRADAFPSETFAIVDLYISLIDTELVRLHSEVEEKLENANFIIGSVYTIYSLSDVPGVTDDIDRYGQLLRSRASIADLSTLRFDILSGLTDAALAAGTYAVRTAKEDLRLLDDKDRKDWMIAEMAEDVALVHSSASQWIDLWNASASQLFAYEQAQDLAYHILLIRSLGSPSGQMLMELKHSKSAIEFVGGQILGVIPFAGSIVSIGSDAWDWIDTDDFQRPPTDYQPYNTWLIRTRQSAQIAIDQHDAFLTRLRLAHRGDFRLPSERARWGQSPQQSGGDLSLSDLTSLQGHTTYQGPSPTSAAALAELLESSGVVSIQKSEGGRSLRYSKVGGALVPGSVDFTVEPGDALFLGAGTNPGSARSSSASVLSLSDLTSLRGYTTYQGSSRTTAAVLFDLLESRGVVSIQKLEGGELLRYSEVGGALVPGSVDFMVEPGDALFLGG